MVVVDIDAKEELSQFKKMDKMDYRDVTELVNCDNLELDFLEYTHEGVNQWAEGKEGNVGEWWLGACMNILDIEGQEDLIDDVERYSEKAIENILMNLPIIDFVDWDIDLGEDDGLGQGDTDSVISEKVILSGSVRGLPYELFAVTAILVRKWLKKKELTQENLKVVLEFCRQFRIKHGLFLPYDQVRILQFTAQVFSAQKSDKERMEIAKMCHDYQIELMRGACGQPELANCYLGDIEKWLKKQDGGDGWVVTFPHQASEMLSLRRKGVRGMVEKNKTRDVFYGKSHIEIEVTKEDCKINVEHIKESIKRSKKIILKLSIRNTEEDNEKLCEQLEQSGVFGFEAGGQERKQAEIEEFKELIKQLLANARDAGGVKYTLDQIPTNFSVSNWSRNIAESVSSLYGSEQYHRVHEADPLVAVNYLSSDEFEDQYLGSGRDDFEKVEYGIFDKQIQVYSQIMALWNISEYQDQYRQMPRGKEKCYFLISALHAQCSQRDQMIAEALGWDSLIYLEDISKVQQCIDECEDSELLIRLNHAFFHPLLKLSVSRRLWNIKSEMGASVFLRSVSYDVVKKATEALKDIPSHLITDEVLTIIICHSHPSYMRDVLIWPLVNKAVDEKSTLALASLLLEPPPSKIGNRSASILAVSESLLDALSELDSLDKEEAILYLLGHDRFYPGIDARFFPELKEEINERRGWYLYDKTFKISIVEDSLSDSKYENVTSVAKPDAIILMSKFAGIPIELIFEQQKTATTRREQSDLLDSILTGENGILKNGRGQQFLKACAETIVDNADFSESLTTKGKEAVKGLLICALQNCPQQKVTDLFLDCMLLQDEKELSLPNLVAKLMQQYGAVFIKAGQYLATQTASLPIEWIHAFRALCDQNQASDKTLLYEYEYASYGQESPFEYLGEKIGEGSMAAVYKGGLHDGKIVAAKVLHPWVENEIEEDVQFLQKIVDYINLRHATYQVTLPDNLPEITKKQMHEEVSFINETHNNDLLRQVLSEELNGVRFQLPHVIQEAGNDRFLVLEYSKGLPLDDKRVVTELGLDERQVRHACGIEIIRQIICNGVYQADPNLGNFRVRQEEGAPIVSWLDTGHIARFSENDQLLVKKIIAQFMFAAPLRDISVNLAEIIDANGGEKEKITKVLNQWAEEMLHAKDFNLNQIESILHSLLDVCAKNKWVLRESWVRLIKTFGLLRPLLHDCDPQQLQTNLMKYFVI